MAATPIVSKVEFARLRKVSLRRVYQWLSSGQIGPEAIVRGRIRVDVATDHLRERLDPSQRFGLNGLSTRLDDAAPASIHVEQRIKQEKLRQAELITIRAEERDRLARAACTSRHRRYRKKTAVLPQGFSRLSTAR